MSTPKPVEEARANLEASIPNIGERYAAGIRRANWADAASSDQAEQNYGTGVQRAIAAKTRQNAIRKVGNQAWQDAAVEKGAPIIGQRVRDSLNKYEQNFGQVYAGVVRMLGSLKPRTLDANANIDNRVKPVVKAWQDNKRR